VGWILWLVVAALVTLLARGVPHLRRRLLAEAVAAVAAAVICGAIATWLDFGGWSEADWRALLFVLFGSSFAIAAGRVTLSASETHNPR
jgi:uncharacterized membrane protein YeaQ/YmgE (transglycosylase-associated protein family)